MSGWVLSAIPEKLRSLLQYQPLDQEVPLPSEERIDAAVENAAGIESKFMFLQNCVHERYPHLVRAEELAEDVLKTLSLQHGGVDPYFLLSKWLFKERLLKNLDSGQRLAVEKVVERWENAHEEFWIWGDVDASIRRRESRRPCSEEEIFKIVKFMQQWLEHQRTAGSQFHARVD